MSRESQEDIEPAGSAKAGIDTGGADEMPEETVTSEKHWGKRNGFQK